MIISSSVTKSGVLREERDLLSSSMMIEYYHDTLPDVKLIRPASFSGSMGRKGYKRWVSGNRMRKFPGAGDVLLIRPSTGFTHPEEGKKLCKKRGKGMRIICNPGHSEQQALNFIFAGMNPVIFSPCAAAAVLLVPFSLWGGGSHVHELQRKERYRHGRQAGL